jgi:hypothetical protein
MREFRLYGSVRGALSNGRPYREHNGANTSYYSELRCSIADNQDFSVLSRFSSFFAEVEYATATTLGCVLLRIVRFDRRCSVRSSAKVQA